MMQNHQLTHATPRDIGSFINENKGFYSFTHRNPHIVENTVVYLSKMQTFQVYIPYGGAKVEIVSFGAKITIKPSQISLCQLLDSFPDLFEMFGKL